MDSLVLEYGYWPGTKEPVSRLVHRQFAGPPNPDYSTVLRIDNQIAYMLGQDGVVIWSRHISLIASRPGVVFLDNPGQHHVTCEVRKDISDTKPAVGTFEIERWLAESICDYDKVIPIKWLYGEPSRADLHLAEASS